MFWHGGHCKIDKDECTQIHTMWQFQVRATRAGWRIQLCLEDHMVKLLRPTPLILFPTCFFLCGSYSELSHGTIFTVCSYTFMLFWLTMISVSVETSQFTFCKLAYMIKNLLTRRKESDTYLDTVSRYHWSRQITMKIDKIVVFSQHCGFHQLKRICLLQWCLLTVSR